MTVSNDMKIQEKLRLDSFFFLNSVLCVCSLLADVKASIATITFSPEEDSHSESWNNNQGDAVASQKLAKVPLKYISHMRVAERC